MNKKLFAVLMALSMAVGSFAHADVDVDTRTRAPGGFEINPYQKRVGSLTGVTIVADYKGLVAMSGTASMTLTGERMIITPGSSGVFEVKASSVTFSVGALSLKVDTTIFDMVTSSLGVVATGESLTLNVSNLSLSVDTTVVDLVVSSLGVHTRGTLLTLTMDASLGLLDTINLPIFTPKDRVMFSVTITHTLQGVAPDSFIKMPVAGRIVGIGSIANTEPLVLQSLNLLKNSTVMFTAAGPKITLTANNDSTIVQPTALSAFAKGDTLKLSLENALSTTLTQTYTFVADLDRNLEANTFSIAEVLVGKAGTIVDVRAYAQTAPVGANLTIRILKNGTAQTTLTITDGANNTATPFTTDTEVAAGDRLTADILAVGSTTPGAELTVVFTLRRVRF